MLNRMRHTGWSILLSPGEWGGGRNGNSRMGILLFGFRRRMHPLLIMNWLRRSKLNERPLWKDKLPRVLQEHGAFIGGSWHGSHWYWETPIIRMMFQDNGTMNSHSILGWILWFPDGWETNFCQCLSMQLRSIPNLTKTKHQIRHSSTNLKVIQMPCLVHLLLKRRCYFVLCQAKFLIWSGGSHTLLGIIWIFSKCMWKWAMKSAQKCSSNSNIHQIPLCL